MLWMWGRWWSFFYLAREKSSKTTWGCATLRAWTHTGRVLLTGLILIYDSSYVWFFFKKKCCSNGFAWNITWRNEGRIIGWALQWLCLMADGVHIYMIEQESKPAMPASIERGGSSLRGLESVWDTPQSYWSGKEVWKAKYSLEELENWSDCLFQPVGSMTWLKD